MATEQERTAARTFLADRISDAVMQAMRESTEPLLVYRAVPMVLVGLAGSHLLTIRRERVLGDGQVDKLLASLHASLDEHADPRLNDKAQGIEE